MWIKRIVGVGLLMAFLAASMLGGWLLALGAGIAVGGSDYLTALLGSTLWNLVRFSPDGPPPPEETNAVGLGLALVSWLLGALLLSAGRRTGRAGMRRFASVAVVEDFTGPARPFVLYLRSFVTDAKLYRFSKPATANDPVTGEQVLMRYLKWLRMGRIIAVGVPGERTQVAGATRFYLPLDDWKPHVSRVMREARATVILAADTPGTVWEFTELVRVADPRRVILLCHTQYAEFRDAVNTRAQTTIPPLPDLSSRAPSQPKGQQLTFPQGAMTFDERWVPTYTHFDIDPTKWENSRAVAHTLTVDKFIKSFRLRERDIT